MDKLPTPKNTAKLDIYDNFRHFYTELLRDYIHLPLAQLPSKITSETDIPSVVFPYIWDDLTPEDRFSLLVQEDYRHPIYNQGNSCMFALASAISKTKDTLVRIKNEDSGNTDAIKHYQTILTELEMIDRQVLDEVGTLDSSQCGYAGSDQEDVLVANPVNPKIQDLADKAAAQYIRTHPNKAPTKSKIGNIICDGGLVFKKHGGPASSEYIQRRFKVTWPESENI